MDAQEKAVEDRKTSTVGKVDVSSKSKEIADILAAIDRLPDVRDSKVQEIKQRIETGMYTIDPRKIAEKMLRRL